MKRLTNLVLIFFVYTLPVLHADAQSSRLQQGLDYFNGGYYERALESLTLAINQDQSLTPELLAQAYYYRGLTYVRLYNEAFAGEDAALQKSLSDALLSAYKDYMSSLKNDNGILWKQIDLEVKGLHHPLLQEGLTALNNYNQQVFQGKADPKLLARAEDYLAAAHEIKETYLVCDLLGQVKLDKGLRQEALAYFEKSEKLYTLNLPDMPDFLMAYVFYRMAAIHKSEDIRLAMQDNQRGINLMTSEFNRYVLSRDKLLPEMAEKLEEQYKLAIKDLNNLKLDLYLSDDALYVEAVHVFEEELMKDSTNVELKIGYASLMEKTDKEKALEIYKEVIELDPRNSIALFNAGALLYSKGKELFTVAQGTTDSRQFDILVGEANQDFRMAKPYFEGALAEDPGSLETIQALKTIAFVLDDKDEYGKYQEMESALSR